MREKKASLAPGEILKLKDDECFKIMFANKKHIRILTMLLSKILKTPYETLSKSKIHLETLTNQNVTAGEKKTECDIAVSVKKDDKITDKIMLEVNIRSSAFQTIIDRDNFYFSDMIANAFPESEGYKNLPNNLLVNFNNFSLNKRGLIFDEYMYRNVYGDVLTEKSRILNIDIAKCYQLWYNKGIKEENIDNYSKDLTLISAALSMDKKKDFMKCMNKVEMSPEIRSEMEGVLDNMCRDEKLVSRYYNREEEERRIQEGIYKEIAEKTATETREATKKEMIIKMYNQNATIEFISSVSDLTSSEIEKIINDYLAQAKNDSK